MITMISDPSIVPGPQYIYESPDGGQTVYAREHGSDRKYIVKSQESLNAARETLRKRVERLLTILVLSETDITLKDSLEQLEVLYILKYGDEKNT